MESQLQEKESVQTAVPCSHGKVCNWDTAKDNVFSRMHRAEKTTSQACAETNLLNSKESHPLFVRQKGTDTATESSEGTTGKRGMGKCGELLN